MQLAQREMIESVIRDLDSTSKNISLSDLNFNDLPLKSDIRRGIRELKFTNLSQIQEDILLPILQNPFLHFNLKGNPGSGKTVAIGIAVANRIDVAEKSLQILWIAPTFEVAIQTANFIRSLNIHEAVKIELILPSSKGNTRFKLLLNNI